MTTPESREKTQRVLLITPTDLDDMWNNVEHSRIKWHRDIGSDVTVVYSKFNKDSRPPAMLWDAITFRTRARIDDGVRTLRVDPFMNYCGGVQLATRTASADNGDEQRERRTTKRRLIDLLAPLALLRDVFWAPCYFLAISLRERRRHDVCLAIGPWSALVGIALRKLKRVRVVIYEDRDYDPGLMTDPRRKSLLARVERWCLLRADTVISVGHRLAARRHRDAGVQTTVIPNGIHIDAFKPYCADPSSTKTMIYVGNITSWSGIELVLEALPRLFDLEPEARLRVIGAGLPSYEAHLRDIVERTGTSDRVEFAGPLQHALLPEALAKGALGLANSQPVEYRSYACPLKVIEYFAAGLPVVATTNTEAADLVMRHDAGITIPYHTETFAQRVASLLQDDQLRGAMGERARAASTSYDWADLLRREQGLIDQAMDPGAEERAPAARGAGGTP